MAANPFRVFTYFNLLSPPLDITDEEMSEIHSEPPKLPRVPGNTVVVTADVADLWSQVRDIRMTGREFMHHVHAQVTSQLENI